MNDPSNPGRVYNTDERLAGAAEREPPPKPVRKPDPSLRQLQRQISIGQVGNIGKSIHILEESYFGPFWVSPCDSTFDIGLMFWLARIIGK